MGNWIKDKLRPPSSKPAVSTQEEHPASREGQRPAITKSPDKKGRAKPSRLASRLRSLNEKK